MTEHEFTLADRIAKIKSINDIYDLEHNAYISFSGGKDSTVLHYLIDEALPNNKIPRVYANTGIDYKLIIDFVKNIAKTDSRFVIIKPEVNIKKMLASKGYPFKSKSHAEWLDRFQRNGMNQSIHNYLDDEMKDKTLFKPCPKKLRYQFSKDFTLRISDKCCFYLKEQPMKKWSKQNNKQISITGIMREEGGRRAFSKCLITRDGKIKFFHPLTVVTKDFEDWYISSRGINICDIYKPPYNFKRTGCKGCPFALNLQESLDTMKNFFPNERRQCEYLWKPVYEEYRRIGYRLRPLNLFEQEEFV